MFIYIFKLKYIQIQVYMHIQICVYIYIYAYLYSMYRYTLIFIIGDSLDYSLYKSDLALLEDIGIRLLYLPRLRAEHRKVSFTEMVRIQRNHFNIFIIEYRYI
jgi:hypothetical protein